VRPSGKDPSTAFFNDPVPPEDEPAIGGGVFADPANWQGGFFVCPHRALSTPRARKTASGSVQYRRQCLDCGLPVGTQVAKTVARRESSGRIAAFDEDLFEKGHAWADAGREARHAQKRDAWWAWYDEYLKSPEWRALRDKVMWRAHGVCEGCFERAAVHIHHRTYDHVGRELLFELVALCKVCHDVAHSPNPDAMPYEMRLLEMLREREARS
jgi:5-methylcytosine-specific restriction endonuclease McrA